MKAVLLIDRQNFLPVYKYIYIFFHLYKYIDFVDISRRYINLKFEQSGFAMVESKHFLCQNEF